MEDGGSRGGDAFDMSNLVDHKQVREWSVCEPCDEVTDEGEALDRWLQCVTALRCLEEKTGAIVAVSAGEGVGVLVLPSCMSYYTVCSL